MNAKQTLIKYFGYDTFKPGQEEIIDAVLSGNDVLAVMPTGAGKSICYQVPALLFPGITIVISPLISLMQDQVKALNEAGIHAGYINSSLTDAQIAKVYARAAEGAYKILYIAPERLESQGFVEFTERIHISMVTVDEAHCISQWGQDFRPSYMKIIDFIDRLRERPIVSAFTATATEEVKTDISCVLKLQDPKIVVTGFDRENLYFRVETTGKKDDFVLEYIRKNPNESGIVYCATRKNVDKLYEQLSVDGIPATKYHAGMNNEDRKVSQDDFIYDRSLVIVATNAFGMGIDKSNVRFVIHYNMPQSMENYYQEAGACGNVSKEKGVPGKKVKKQKRSFYLNPEDGDKYEFKNLSLLTEIRDELNRITSADNVKHIFGTDLFRLLTAMGYVKEQEVEGKLVQTQTELGLSKGIAVTEKISKAENAYTVLLYPPEVQKEIVEFYIEMGNQTESDGSGKDAEGDEYVENAGSGDAGKTARVEYNRKMNRPDGAGKSWTEEEDKQLDDEYQSGMTISGIARIHDRTNGAIRARLKKHGSIE